MREVFLRSPIIYSSSSSIYQIPNTEHMAYRLVRTLVYKRGVGIIYAYSAPLARAQGGQHYKVENIRSLVRAEYWGCNYGIFGQVDSQP